MVEPGPTALELAGIEDEVDHQAALDRVAEAAAEVEGPDATERALASAARAASFLGAVPRLAPKVTVKVRPAPRGRATGWSLDCPDHGPMPVLAPGRSSAIAAAQEHLELDHGGRGTIDAVNEGAGTKPRRKGKRRR